MQNELVAQAHVENYALKLFLYADNEDRAGRFGKFVNFHCRTCSIIEVLYMGSYELDNTVQAYASTM